jgi:hypothetical protein
MRRSSIAVGAAMLVVLVVGALVLVDRGRAGREDQPVRFGVLAKERIGALPAGRTACQSPVDIDRPVRRLGLAFDTARGPALRVSVRDLRSREVLRTVEVPAGYSSPLGGFLTVELGDPIGGDRSLEICARNLGRRTLELVGDNTVDYSQVRVGRPLGGGADWAIFFPMREGERRSYLAMASDMLHRATIIRPGIVTPLFYGVLALFLVVAAPLLLWRAVLVAADEPGGGSASPPPPTAAGDPPAASAPAGEDEGRPPTAEGLPPTVDGPAPGRPDGPPAEAADEPPTDAGAR